MSAAPEMASHGAIPEDQPDEATAPPARSRRGAVTRRRFLTGLAATATVGIPAAWDTFRARLTRRDLWFPNLPTAWDGARILHLSDLHRGPLVPAAYLRHALEAARALPHDLLALTGDYVSLNAGYVDDVLEMLRGWRPRRGVWAVLGNHDHATDAARVTRALQSLDIPVLNNEPADAGGGAWIAGTDDPATNRQDLDRATAGIPPRAFRILLAHSPDVAWRFRPGLVDLALCGHTHGGQVCLPGGQAIISATSMGVDYARGTFLWREATLFVNRGLGVVGLPLRTFCPPEIALLTLRRGDSARAVP